MTAIAIQFGRLSVFIALAALMVATQWGTTWALWFDVFVYARGSCIMPGLLPALLQTLLAIVTVGAVTDGLRIWTSTSDRIAGTIAATVVIWVLPSVTAIFLWRCGVADGTIAVCQIGMGMAGTIGAEAANQLAASALVPSPGRALTRLVRPR